MTTVNYNNSTVPCPEIFTDAMLDALRRRFDGIKTIDPDSDTYESLIRLLNAMSQPVLRQVAEAKIKFLSLLARNRLREPLPLGRTTITRTALAEMIQNGENPAEYLTRHANGDWGNLEECDIRANERAIRDGERVLSAYNTRAGKIYVITEADRSFTTTMLAQEY